MDDRTYSLMNAEEELKGFAWGASTNAAYLRSLESARYSLAEGPATAHGLEQGMMLGCMLMGERYMALL